MGAQLKLPVIVILLLVIASGCSTDSAIRHSAVNTLDFTFIPDVELCAIYGYGKNRAMEAEDELRRRSIFSGDDWSDIENGRIKPGMSLCAVYASFTNISREFSEKMDAHGDDLKEIIYDCRDGRVPFCPFTRVSLKNDRVTGISRLDSL